MTPKEQELKEAISSALLWQPDDVRREVAECLLSKARECYSEELQAERMVTFKLSQQIEKKDAALKECLEFFESEGMEGMKQTVKTALDR